MLLHTDLSAHVWEIAFLALQALLVVFLPFHDWIPLGRLNDVRTIRLQGTGKRLAQVGLMLGLPMALGLVFSIRYFGETYPNWLDNGLWGFYGVMFLLEVRAFWVPYLLFADEARAAHHTREFRNTHAFLPRHNGMVPNTLHVALHACVLVTLIVFYMSERSL